MPLETTVFKGYRDRPAVIFIHGLGMDKNIWIDPFKSRILAGSFPITTVLSNKPMSRDLGSGNGRPSEDFPFLSIGEKPDILQTLFHDLRQKGNTVVTWSQKSPAVPVDYVVQELKKVVEECRKITRAGIILVGHSRGGLIGRRYLMSKDRSIRGLVTISTPHKGSSIARLAGYVSPIMNLISPFFSDKERGTFSFAIRRISEFLRSRALRELLPESGFIRSLQDRPCDRVSYVTIGGTNPTLFSIYRWKSESVREGAYQKWFLKPEELFSVPDIFERVIPKKLYPNEMKKGKGDWLVSEKSSRIPWSSEHHVFNLNHVQIVFDKGVRETLEKAIEKMT